MGVGFPSWQDTSVSRRIWHSDHPEIKAYRDYGADFRLSVSNNPGNQSLQKMIEGRIAGAEQILIDFLSGNPAGLDEHYKWLIYCYSTERYGRFLQEYTLIYAPNTGRFTNEIYRVYDTVTGKQIRLADCFVSGIDYKALLIPLLKENFDISDLESWEDINIRFSPDGYLVMDLSRSHSESGGFIGYNPQIVL